LVTTLNGRELQGEGRDRVLRIIGLLRTRRWYMSRLLQSDPATLESKQTVSLMEVLLSDADTLNAMLQRYTLAPQVNPIQRVPSLMYIPTDEVLNGLEAATVMRILHLAERDDLDRVRDCNCGRFFLAGRIDQQHCSVACRVKAHQSSDEFKAKRRIAERERYKLKRSGKVKQ